MDNQQLILVDDKDNFLGYKDRKTCHLGKGFHHRAFVVCLFNDKYEILLQKRKHALWDGFWDVTAISHPLHLKNHDETYEEGGLRALKAEMGIVKVFLEKIGGFNYFVRQRKNCENEYCAVLIGKYNGSVKIDSNLVYEYKWMDIKLFIRDCKKNSKNYAPWTIYTADTISKKNDSSSNAFKKTII